MLSDVASKHYLASLASCQSHSSELNVFKILELDKVNSYLRSGQFRDLPMSSQWANFQLPLFCIRTFPFTRNGVALSHQWLPRCQFSSVTSNGHLRSPKVTNRFFANNFWFRRDRDVGVVSLCFSHQDAIFLYAIWPTWVTTWPWPEVKFWPWLFKVIIYMFRCALTMQRRWC